MNHNVFALELCLRLQPEDDLRPQLADLVLAHPEASRPGPKWQMMQRAVQLLLANDHLFEKGCWDFFDDDQKARSDYDMWCKGMTTEEGARKEPSGRPVAHGEPRFMTFTLSMLVVAGTSTAEALARTCDIREADLWKKATFLKILRGLNAVSFAAVKSDVLYLIPKDEGWGLTLEDLRHEKFAYLRPIV